MSIRHVDHQRDGAAMREVDVRDGVTRPRQQRILIERDHLELGPQQIKVRCRQGGKKAITHSRRRRHCRDPAAKDPRPSPSGAFRNGGLTMSLNLLSLHTHSNNPSTPATNCKRTGARRTARMIFKELDANGAPDATVKYAWVTP